MLTKKKLDGHRNQCWGASFTVGAPAPPACPTLADSAVLGLHGAFPRDEL